jgi:hypothetical protein
LTIARQAPPADGGLTAVTPMKQANALSRYPRERQMRLTHHRNAATMVSAELFALLAVDPVQLELAVARLATVARRRRFEFGRRYLLFKTEVGHNARTMQRTRSSDGSISEYASATRKTEGNRRRQTPN